MIGQHVARSSRMNRTIGDRSVLFAILGGGGYLVVVFILELFFTPPFVSQPTFSGFGFLVYYVAFVGAIVGASTIIAEKAGLLCWFPSFVAVCWIAYSLEGELIEQFDVYDTTCLGQVVLAAFLFACGVAVSVTGKDPDNKDVGTDPATPPKNE